ncbi:MAG: hypothetical protein DME22_11565 [Verrucomicrobia bacterium]|nr:MAG: hypothetical protein DME22_11565 [Verrucomicrobiota bacterium]
MIVIDTNIFDQHGYNFAAQVIQKFVAVTQVKSLTILLPDAIEREVRRHIKDKSAAAQSALKKARHDAPFLQKWKNWPAPEKVKTAKDDIAAAYIADWEEFLKNFKVKRLGYDGINMNQVMDWHDQQQPPFGPGQKEKEFPDAFALASTLAYAKAESTRIAVVSKDNDFAKFCVPHPELPFFSDLSALTEAFVDEMKTHVKAIKAVLAAHPEQFLAQIREAFPDLTFYPEEDIEGDVEDVEVLSVELDKMRVISIEDEYCTIAFAADVKFSAYVSYDDPDTMVIDSSEDFRMALYQRAGTVTETAGVSGTITLEFDDDWKTILSASDLELESQTITIETRPPIRYGNDDAEEPSQEDFEPPQPPHPEQP